MTWAQDTTDDQDLVQPFTAAERSSCIGVRARFSKNDSKRAPHSTQPVSLVGRAAYQLLVRQRAQRGTKAAPLGTHYNPCVGQCGWKTCNMYACHSSYQFALYRDAGRRPLSYIARSVVLDSCTRWRRLGALAVREAEAPMWGTRSLRHVLSAMSPRLRFRKSSQSP